MSVLSVVVPAYNEELMISQVCRKVRDILTESRIAYELLFVDDGSKDRTWDEIVKASEIDRHVRGIRFSTSAKRQLCQRVFQKRRGTVPR